MSDITNIYYIRYEYYSYRKGMREKLLDNEKGKDRKRLM